MIEGCRICVGDAGPQGCVWGGWTIRCCVGGGRKWRTIKVCVGVVGGWRKCVVVGVGGRTIWWWGVQPQGCVHRMGAENPRVCGGGTKGYCVGVEDHKGVCESGWGWRNQGRVCGGGVYNHRRGCTGRWGGGGPKGMCVCVVGELKAIVWVCGSGGPQGCVCRVIRGVEDPRGCVGEPQTVVWVVGEDHRSVCVVGGL